MSPKQTQYYWGLWNGAKKAQPDLDRKALHAELGLPESSKAFQQEHFDAWKSRCLALAQPGNYRAQVETVAMPRTRRVWLAETLSRALGEVDAEYALATARRMNRKGGLGAPEAELALEDLGEEALDALVTALRKACRRAWPTKLALIGGMNAFAAERNLDEEAVRAAGAEALHVAAMPDWEDLHYDKLLIVMAALRYLAEQPF